MGAIWGLGHGVTEFCLGLVIFFVKGTITLTFPYIGELSSGAVEAAIGVSLIAIGLIGVKENFESELPLETVSHELDLENNSDSAKNKSDSTNNTTNILAILTNGMLHGFSWDGAPSIMPAMAMSSWLCATTFLLSYCIGNIVTMSLTALTLSDFSHRISNISRIPDLPRKLSVYSSLLAIIIGLFWVFQAVVLPQLLD